MKEETFVTYDIRLHDIDGITETLKFKRYSVRERAALSCKLAVKLNPEGC